MDPSKNGIEASKIAPRLWQGAAPGQGKHLASAGFKALVLCAVQYQPPAEAFPGVDVYHAPMRDTLDFSERELGIALKAAAWLAEKLTSTKDVALSSCMAGLNRSGLVTSMGLAIATGKDPAWCGELVRRKRGEEALHNPTFVDMLNSMRDEPCELCDAELLTQRYYDDHLVWIADCKTCSKPGKPAPMAVLRRHSLNPSQSELRHIMRALDAVRTHYFQGWEKCKVEKRMDSIKDHWHAHMTRSSA